MSFTAAYWKHKLNLAPHVEGGAYRQTYRSNLNLSRQAIPDSFHGDRPASTAIYFLLEHGEFSALHRLASDELWHFYYGDPLIIYEIDLAGNLHEHTLAGNGSQPNFQCLIKAGSWFGSRVKEGGNYSLVGCTVAPGFDFEDFELADRSKLVLQYPQHTGLIVSLTR